MRAADPATPPLTPQQARAHVLTAAAQIIASLPVEVVLHVEHHDDDLCHGDRGLHAWRTFTTVTLTPGTDAEPLVRMREQAFRERGDVDVTARRDEAGAWEFRVRSMSDTSGCIVGEGAPGTIWIDSWSPSFSGSDGIRPDR